MNTLFIILLLVSVAVLFVGLIQPQSIKFSSRKKVIAIFGGAIILFFILIGVTSSSKATLETVPSVGTTQQVTATVPTSDTPKKNETVVPSVKTVTHEPVVVLDLSGSGAKSTQEFTVGRNWSLSWSYDCNNFGQSGNFIVTTYNANNSIDFGIPMVNQLGNKDSGTENYYQAGTYHFSVNSECSWKVIVKS